MKSKTSFSLLMTGLIFLSLSVISTDAFSQKKKKNTPEPGTYTSLEDAMAVDPLTVLKLDLSKKKLKTFPLEIFKFTNLMQLNVSKNKLVSLPENIGDLKKLTYLDVSKNKLTSIPESISKMSMLNSFKMSENKITTLPRSFFTMTSLEILDFYSNPLIFDPQQFSKFSKKLKYIDVRNTGLNTDQCKMLESLLPTTKIKFDKSCNCQ